MRKQIIFTNQPPRKLFFSVLVPYLLLLAVTISLLVSGYLYCIQQSRQDMEALQISYLGQIRRELDTRLTAISKISQFLASQPFTVSVLELSDEQVAYQTYYRSLNEIITEQNGLIAEEGWREYVALMNDWYEKGLIDPDFMASTAAASILPDTAMVTTGKTGAFVGIYTNVAVWEAAIEGDQDSFIPVYTPVKQEGDTHNFQSVDLSAATATMGLSVSAKSEHVEECLKLFDYWFSEEGALFCNYGLENDTFQFNEEGDPVFTDKILHNSDGLSFAQAMAYYTFPPSGPVYQDWTRELGSVPEKDIVCYDVWGKGTNSQDMPTPDVLGMDPELYSEWSSIMTNIQTVVDESTPQFISGVRSLDEYDAYLQTLEDFHVDRAVEIVQQAYDDFISR